MMRVKNKMRVLLGMSGGFDSSYAAHKLKAEGHEVEGAVLVMHPYTDVSSARSSAEGLGIPLHVIDCQELFESEVIRSFISEYRKGRTPNPCIICNPAVKFKVLLEWALSHGFDKIATGHYARISEVKCDKGIRYTLIPPADRAKDQSYMLARLPQNILSRLILPLADEVKCELRRKVRDDGLPIEDRQDSQEICFIPSGGYADFLTEHMGAPKEGDFIDSSGNVLGRHKGITGYTVGQRKGLGISLGRRMFVGRIDPENNTVTLLDDGISVGSVTLSDTVFSAIEEPKERITLDAFVKIRYAAPKVPAAVTFYPDGVTELAFLSPVNSPAPGQTAVIYGAEGEVIAAGFIK